ncbi:hypothetical protein BD779DRAFT_1540951 [Infundibulicybe gibba]|nr:hypothetical protein BD779DRAFT_1540951 [Infundibulicybe gibba]
MPITPPKLLPLLIVFLFFHFHVVSRIFPIVCHTPTILSDFPLFVLFPLSYPHPLTYPRPPSYIRPLLYHRSLSKSNP